MDGIGMDFGSDSTFSTGIKATTEMSVMEESWIHKSSIILRVD
jgi:hypothetical protein